MHKPGYAAGKEFVSEVGLEGGLCEFMNMALCLRRLEWTGMVVWLSATRFSK